MMGRFTSNDELIGLQKTREAKVRLMTISDLQWIWGRGGHIKLSIRFGLGKPALTPFLTYLYPSLLVPEHGA